MNAIEYIGSINEHPISLNGEMFQAGEILIESVEFKYGEPMVQFRHPRNHRLISTTDEILDYFKPLFGAK